LCFTIHNRMLYSWIRGSHIRPHRDNSGWQVQQDFMYGQGAVDDAGSGISYIAGSEAPSQIPGSTVMVFSTGNAPMEISMRCIDPAEPKAGLKDYPLRVAGSFEAGDGTVYLLHPFDDIWWTHGTIGLGRGVFGGCGVRNVCVCMCLLRVRMCALSCLCTISRKQDMRGPPS
jgi:hypothetical protein